MVYHDKHSYSQNFIKSSILVSQLIEAAEIDASDLVVEVGPGKGIITEVLLEKSRQVIAIEKDKNLYNELFQRLGNNPKLSLYNKDFLLWNLPQKKFKIFSNIPFSITSEIINKIVRSNQQPEAAYFIVQKEAAEKFTGNKNIETQSSILTKPWFKPEIIGDIDRNEFSPKPQVDIVFMSLQKREQPLIQESDKLDFRDFVVYGFNQWKPDILESYKKIFSYNQLKLINQKLKIIGCKPSQVSFESWIKLFETYKFYVSEEKKRLTIGSEKRFWKKMSSVIA